MGKIVRIGGACAFYGDSSVAAPQLLDAGIDYMVLDYLAEATMSVLGAMRARRPDLGYARDFTEWVWKDNLEALKRSGTRIVTNAGGLNPHACAARMAELATKQGLSFRIAVIDGDDMRDRLAGWAGAGVTEMFTGRPFPDPDAVLTANAYLGATPIAAALAMGADVVITGRVVDSALTLGPLIHEFGWGADDHDLLSAGSLAGHVIECGAQATGGLFTDWEQVPDWAHIGYPIVECAADGGFVVTKPEGTGGIVTPAAVAEQIVYEVGDPQLYYLPDVTCDFSRVQVRAAGPDRVAVTGAIGRPPTGRYKVSITWRDGFRALTFLPVVGRDAVRKAERQAEAVMTRVGEMLAARNLPPFRASRIEALGAEASYGANARARDTREVVCKLAVEHDEEAPLQLLLREADAPATSMAVGTTGWFGARAQVHPVTRVFSTTIARGDVAATVHLDGAATIVPVPDPAVALDPDGIDRPAEGERAATAGTITVPLIDLAWARSGDKGDAFNVGVIARAPEFMPYVRRALSEEAVGDWFAHEFEAGKPAGVKRFEWPGLGALNFLCSNSLGGGQFASLRLDPLAKGKAQQLLDFPIAVPAEIAAQVARRR